MAGIDAAAVLLLKKLTAQAVQSTEGFFHRAGKLVAAPAIGAGVFRHQGGKGGGKLGRIQMVKFPGGQGQGQPQFVVAPDGGGHFP